MNVRALLHHRPGLRRVLAATAAAVTGLAGLFAVPAAQAAPGGAHYVAFGDSYAANPTVAEQFAGFVTPDNCGQGADAYPVRLGHKLGVSTYNAACNGGTLTNGAGPSVGLLADRAAERGQLGENTRLVTLTVGAAEGWNPEFPAGRDFGVINGGDFLNHGEFVARMRGALDTVRRHAPNARILFVGYPEVGNERGEVCVANVDLPPGAGQANLAAPVPTAATGFVNKVNDIARDSAGELGYEFVETRRPGTGTCAPTATRWVHGLLDNQIHQMLYHPSSLGNEMMAQLTADYLG